MLATWIQLFKSVCFHGFTSLGISASLAFLLTLGVSSFEGGRGYAALALFCLFFIAYIAVFFIVRLTIRKSISKYIKIGIFCACLPAWVLGLGPLVYEATKQKLKQTTLTFAEKAAIEQNLKQVSEDWARGLWQNAKPLCLELGDNQWNNQCPKPVEIKYCWEMDKSREYEDVQFDCSKNQYSLTVVQVGKSTLVTPWCRSYTGLCVAEMKPKHATSK
jgi:hypothetical protein